MPRVGSSPMLALANQASAIFGPNGAHPIRQKHLFVVRFLRQAATSQDWKDGLTFVVKQMDRPSVEATTEVVNQYNKKRIIHTGVKYNNVNMTFYDTADGAAQNLWLEYAAYHFGDYKHDYDQSRNSFADDLLNATLNGAETGYGFQIRKDNNEGIGSQHFFDGLEVYQLWANDYISYRLVNPRIVTFTPDDLDYSNSEAATISMSVAYEAISHRNSGRSEDLMDNELLTELFDGGTFDGRRLEFASPLQAQTFAMPGTAIAQATTLSNDYTASDESEMASRSSPSSETGALSRWGNFNFGNTTSSATATGQITDATLRLGGSALSIDGLAQSVNSAAAMGSTSTLDQFDRSQGLQLSDNALGSYNQSRDGTFLMGNRNSLNIT